MSDTPHPATTIVDPSAIVLPLATGESLEAGARIVPIHILSSAGFERLCTRLEPRDLTYIKARDFAAEPGQLIRLPDLDGSTARILYGVGDPDADPEREMRAGKLGARLPEGIYRIEAMPSGWSAVQIAVAWCLGGYRFDTYMAEPKPAPTLILGESSALDAASHVARGVIYGRRLIDMPAGDMGPEALEASTRALCRMFDAEVSSIVGRELLERNYPLIHAVGRAAHEAPRLVEFEWGDVDHPRLAVVGKGITFDTGGVNMKSASGARLMKKDMGGAAHALALAYMIMAAKLPVRLRVLLPIAENAVSAGAYRPGDIIRSRAGLTVEIDNTDAEGRLVLADALSKAVETKPRLMIDFATLTGAARVALGPQLPPFFCNREGPVEAVLDTTAKLGDPVWRLPLWRPYFSELASPVADMKNSGGRFAGAITAALFLERFVASSPWMHFDVYGWNPNARPASPKGAEIYAVRGLFSWLKSGGLNADFG